MLALVLLIGTSLAHTPNALQSTPTVVRRFMPKLGRARTPLVLAQEGAAPPAPAPKDWRAEAAALFNNLRTPAALIAGSAFTGELIHHA